MHREKAKSFYVVGQSSSVVEGSSSPGNGYLTHDNAPVVALHALVLHPLVGVNNNTPWMHKKLEEGEDERKRKRERGGKREREREHNKL